MAVVGSAEFEVLARVANFERDLRQKVQSAADKVKAEVKPQVDSEPFSRFGKVIDAADDKLRAFGISLRDFTGIARLAGPALLAIAGTRFVADLTLAAAALGEAQNLVTVTFGESSEAVLRFAETAPAALGTTETAALNAAGQIGQLGKSFGFTEELAAKLGVTVVRVASDISSLRNVPAEQVQQAIESAFAGESEPLRRLGVDTRETRLEMIALQEGIIQTGESLTSTTRALAVLAAIQRDANDAFGDFDRTAASVPNQLRILGAEVEQLKTNIGGLFVGLASEVLQFASAVVEATNAVIQFGKSSLEAGTDFIEGFVREVEDALKNSPLRPLIDALETDAKQLEGLREDQLRAIADLGTDLSPLAEAELKARDAADGIAASIDELIEKGGELPLTFEALAEIPGRLEDIRDEIDKITDARERLNDVIEDGERRVDDAEKRLIRTISDNERRVDRAEKDLAKTRADAAEDAIEGQKAVLEAEQERIERIAEAEERLAEVRIDAAERVEDARERLAEGRLDARKRIDDAEEALDRAREDRAEAVVDALLGVEEAQAAGDARRENAARRALADAQRDRGVADAKADLVETEKEAQQDIADLEENLAEERIDARKQIAEAEEDLADTIEEQDERVAESKQRLADIEVRNNERLVESRQRLADAEREQAEAVAEAQESRLRAIDESNQKVAEAREKLQEAAGATGDWAERLKVLNDQLQKLNELLAVGTSTGSLGDLVLLNEPGNNAAGGRASAGDWSFVGEKGMELVRFGADAHVTSNADIVSALRELLGGGLGRGDVHIYTQATDPRVLVNELSFKLMHGVTS